MGSKHHSQARLAELLQRKASQRLYSHLVSLGQWAIL